MKVKGSEEMLLMHINYIARVISCGSANR